MKRALIITYYWPPSGGSGVQRWLKFSKYLREFGYEPVIYTPENPEYMSKDHTLVTDIPEGIEVIKRKIWEPYGFYRFFSGKRGRNISPGFINTGGSGRDGAPIEERLSLYIRSNLFFPDPKRWWIKPSVRFLKKYLKKNSIDIIVSTGPPHSMHLIAYELSKTTATPWIADFRDPWTQMYNFKYMKYSGRMRRRHEQMERKIVSSADAVITVTDTICREFRELGPKRVYVITNGFDKEDFLSPPLPVEEFFTITFTGLFVKTQNPSILWEYLGEKAKRDRGFAKDLKIRLIGNIDGSVLTDITNYGVAQNLAMMGYLPHGEVTEWQRRAQILLLSGGSELEAKGIMTGKFFEYLAAKRPILAFGIKGGDMDIALEQSGGGEMFGYNDREGVAGWIDCAYKEYKSEGSIPFTGGDIEKYSRRKLASKMAIVMDELLDKR